MEYTGPLWGRRKLNMFIVGVHGAALGETSLSLEYTGPLWGRRKLNMSLSLEYTGPLSGETC